MPDDESRSDHGTAPATPLPAVTEPAEQCDWCGSTELLWRNCKLLCRNCSAIVKSCADL